MLAHYCPNILVLTEAGLLLEVVCVKGNLSQLILN